jgi:hypothetical protein
MKVAVMQPYFFPYLGYWQLISSVDTFVIFDDVNYFKKGYINRNSILVNNTSYLLTLELLKASQNKKINEIVVGGNAPNILKTISSSYKKAPNFEIVFCFIRQILLNDEDNLAYFLYYLIKRVCDYLDIPTDLKVSSKIEKSRVLKGQERILQICTSLEATHYINAIGGQELYRKEVFLEHKIELSFLKSKSIEYRQYEGPFIPNLSIIDVLMFNDKEQIKKYLHEYDLI